MLTAIVVLLLITVTVCISVLYQNTAADRITEILEKCLEELDRKDMEAFSRSFGEFTAYYEEKRQLMALFMHTDRVEELDGAAGSVKAMLENGDSLTDDSGYDRLASELSSLLDTAERIKESNSLAPSNIF